MIAIDGFLLGLAIVAYIASGYAPGRALRLKAEEIFFVGIGERVLFDIRATENFPAILSVVPLPWPFRHIWIPLKWTEVVKGNDKKTEKVRGKEEAKFKDIETFDVEPESFFGMRDELVPSLRIFEQVAYKITVRSQNKHTLYFIFTIFIEVKEGMKTVGRPNFKLVGSVDLETKLGPWGLGKETNDVLDTDIDSIKDGITFKNKEGESVDMETYLNEKLEPLGCEIHSIALRIIPGSDVQEYFIEGQKMAKLQQARLNQEAQELLRQAERKAELNDAANLAEIAAVEFKGYTKPFKKIVQMVYQGEADVAAQHPHLLVDARHENGRIGVKILETMMNEIGKGTSKDAGKQRREEQKNG